MSFKKVFIAIIVIFVALFAVYQIFIKSNGADYELAKVNVGSVFSQVSETGSIKAGGKINLGFKSSGTLERIYVSVGDEVWPGQSLVKLDTSALNIELSEAEANLEIAQAKLDQLLAGSTQEEIKVAETAVENARQSLENIKTDAEEDIKQAYEDAIAVLDASYSAGSVALSEVVSIRRTYFGGMDQESTLVKSKEEEISASLSAAKTKIDAARAEESAENIESALSELRSALNVSYQALSVIRETTDTLVYKDVVSSTDKTSLNTQKTNVNTALSNIIGAQQTISSTKIANQSNISAAEGALKSAEDELALMVAEPRPEDINLYQAQVRQAQARVDSLQNTIAEATLKSPVHGTVAKINKEVGETVQPALTESVVSILPSDPYKIEAAVYEEDIVRVEINDPVEIELIAFPGRVFKGKVVSIDPAEELIDGVVYYMVTINFDEEVPQGLKPAMTADITIKTDSRENVLIIPEDAIISSEGKSFVRMFEDGEIKEREVGVGLMGEDDMVEIIFGLEEGEEVILN